MNELINAIKNIDRKTAIRIGFAIGLGVSAYKTAAGFGTICEGIAIHIVGEITRKAADKITNSSKKLVRELAEPSDSEVKAKARIGF